MKLKNENSNKYINDFSSASDGVFLRRTETNNVLGKTKPGKSRFIKTRCRINQQTLFCFRNTIQNTMSTKPKMSKVLVALGLSKLTIPQLIANSKLYVQNMTGNANFTAPTPTLAAVTAQINKLEAAYMLSQTRVKGSVADMHSEQKALNILLKSLSTYVEGIANANPEQAVGVIESSGMPVKKKSVHAPKTFTVKTTATPGEVELNTKAVKKAVYTYAMTTDPNTATSWVDIIVNNDVKNTHGGLSSGTRYYFRVATTVKGIQSPWSSVINIMMP